MTELLAKIMAQILSILALWLYHLRLRALRLMVQMMALVAALPIAVLEQTNLGALVRSRAQNK